MAEISAAQMTSENEIAFECGRVQWDMRFLPRQHLSGLQLAQEDGIAWGLALSRIGLWRSAYRCVRANAHCFSRPNAAGEFFARALRAEAQIGGSRCCRTLVVVMAPIGASSSTR